MEPVPEKAWIACNGGSDELPEVWVPTGCLQRTGKRTAGPEFRIKQLLNKIKIRSPITILMAGGKKEFASLTTTTMSVVCPTYRNIAEAVCKCEERFPTVMFAHSKASPNLSGLLLRRLGVCKR